MKHINIATTTLMLAVAAYACSSPPEQPLEQQSSLSEGATDPARLGQVDVDFNAAIPGSPSMTGILHGLGASTSVLPPELLRTHVNPLRPALWRVGRQDTLPQMLGAGTPRIMFILPELLAADGRAWGYADSKTDYDNTPLTTWCAPTKTATAKCLAQWDTHLRSVTGYLRTLAASYPQTMFCVDAWNEPDYGYPYVVKPHDDKNPYAIDDAVGEFVVKVIQDVRKAFGTVPVNVRIGGPSFAYSSSLGSFQKALSTKVVNGVLPTDTRVDYLTWHELDGDGRLEIANDANTARTTFAPFGITELIVNEFVGPDQQYDSSAVLHAMRLLEDGHVSSASRACWPLYGFPNPPRPDNPSNCFNGTLERRSV